MDQITISQDQHYFLQKISYSPFKEQLEANLKNYNIQLQVSKFYKFTENYNSSRCIQLASKEDDDLQIIFIYGNNIPNTSNKQDFESMKIDFFKQMSQITHKPFIIVFFNTNLMTGSAFNDFKEFYTTLPLIYFQHLIQIVVVHANFIVKSGGMFTSNEYLKYFKRITIFADNLFQLSKFQWFRYRMLHALNDQIKQSDLSYKDIEQKIQRTMLLKKKTLEQIENDQTNNDLTEFDRTSKILGQPLVSYPKNINQIPEILNILVQYFHDKPQSLDTEGLFRKQAAVYEERILEAALACQKITFVQSVQNPHVVAGVFKQFLLKLPEPLIPYDIYDYVIQNIGNNFEKDKVNYVKTIYSKIPPFNYGILLFILSFILKVVSHAEHNLMTKYNMGVVFGPSFFRSQVLSMADFQYVNVFVSIVQTMLDTFEEFFPDYRYQDYLERKQDQFQTSLVAYLNENQQNIANIDEIAEMIGEQNIEKVMTEQERQELAQLQGK